MLQKGKFRYKEQHHVCYTKRSVLVLLIVCAILKGMGQSRLLQHTY